MPIEASSTTPPTSVPARITPPPKPKENLWVNLICNAVLPGFLLTQLSKPEWLGPLAGLIVALCVPLGYGVYDLVRRRTWNTISIIGLASVLLTGGIGLLKVSNFWFAVKEAAFSIVLGLAIPLTLRTGQPLVRTLIYNDQVLNTDRIGVALVERNAVSGFDALMRWASWVLAGAFLFSGVLNYFLARWIVTSPPGSPENVAQLGTLNWVSWPVIVLPSLGMMMFTLTRLVKGLQALTGLPKEALFHTPENAPAAPPVL